jgi:mono/diheme cytochrome c family protein
MLTASTRLTSGLLAGGLVAAALGFAWLATPGPTGAGAGAGTPAGSTPAAAPAEAATGSDPAAALFAAQCGACHTVESLARRFRDARDVPALDRRFESFLGDHGEATPAEDRQILDWLKTRAR